MEARGHCRKHMGLRILRDPIEHALIAHDCECPWLLVYRVRCVHGGVDQKINRSLIDSLSGVFANRSATADYLVEIHCAIPAKLGPHNN